MYNFWRSDPSWDNSGYLNMMEMFDLVQGIMGHYNGHKVIDLIKPQQIIDLEALLKHKEIEDGTKRWILSKVIGLVKQFGENPKAFEEPENALRSRKSKEDSLKAAIAVINIARENQ